MRSIQIHSRLVAFVRCALSVAIFLACFQTQLSSAERRRKNATPKKISISGLINLPVVSVTNGLEQVCAGVLVAPKSVLTSKVCLKNIKRNFRRGRLKAQLGKEINKLKAISSSKGLNVGIIRLKQAFKKTRPTKLGSYSRMAFGKDFVVDGIGKDLDGEIGYLNAIYIDSKLTRRSRVISCFGESGMPSLVRSPTAVVGIPTYGFGDCFFDSVVTFQNVGSANVRQLYSSRP